MIDAFTFRVDGREREYRILVINGTPQLVGYGVNLSNADLVGADLEGLDLSYVNLRGATLTFARMAGCNLSFADLTGANTIGADLRGANLHGAITREASLLGADVRGATYNRWSLHGAYISDELRPEYLTLLGRAPVERVGAPGPVAGAEFSAQDVAPANESLTLTSPPPLQPNTSRGGIMRDYSGLLEGLSAGIAELTTSERWTQYLDVQSKFYRYSPSNVMLILLQNPYATRVAGYHAWQELGRQVVAKESALRILAPMTYKKDDGSEGDNAREIRGFKLVPVFDISQTEGPDLPDIVSKLAGHAPDGVFAKLTEFAQGIGFRVERPQLLASGANGDTSHSEGRIRVVSSNSEAQRAKTLAHEIGHALLHDPGVEATKELARGLKELEAESTAYVICAALGMDTSDYSFGYVAGWAGDAAEAIQGIKASTWRIQKAAKAVLETFEVEDRVVKATSLISMGAAIERRDEVLAEFDLIHEIAEASDERVEVFSVGLPLRDSPDSNYEHLHAEELDVLDFPGDGCHELGV
ncbi:MAG: pentapeptide repeat-containing protein [Acidimicrobiales bacterium]